MHFSQHLLVRSKNLYKFMFEYSAHRRMGRKQLGGRKKFAQLFSHCARLVKKIFRAISKIVVGGDDEKNLQCIIIYYNCYIEGGRQNFRLLYSIFPPILRAFLLFIFIITKYCPNWPSLPNKSGPCPLRL